MLNLAPLDLRTHLAALRNEGIILPDNAVYAMDEWKQDYRLAEDAQPTLFTQPNAGIPAWFSTLIDPQVIRILLAPMRSTEIYDEQKKGTWVDTAAEFPTIEPTGFVTSYGDWNNNGNTGANVNWTPRQSYYYQTILQYGEREIDRYGLAKISYVAELQTSAAFVMNKFQNTSYFYGVSGLINYGIINDPSLPASILPNVKAAGGYTWIGTGAGATAQEIYGDFLRLFAQLQAQMGGLLKQTDKIKVVLSPGRAVYLSQVTQYNTVTPMQLIKTGFPNLEFVEAPEFSTPSGELMQMIAESYDGMPTGITAYNEKDRSHPVIPSLSGWQQKKSGGTWGAIIRRPICAASMLGI